MFLELDQPLRVGAQELGLQGIRKAQIKLACYYLAIGRRDQARRRSPTTWPTSRRDRLRAIREQLERVESKEFWEIIDRGRNFEYMPPRQKEPMERFFGWFAEKREPVPARRERSAFVGLAALASRVESSAAPRANCAIFETRPRFTVEEIVVVAALDGNELSAR